MKYTAKYFKDGMPKWKRKKDPINCRYFVRPLSFFGSAFCANHGITANRVSYFSSLVAIASCACFLVDIKTVNIIGALLMNVWLWLDCIDGNIARSVRKEPFGEFADAISSYILVAFMCTSFGVYVYRNGGGFTNSGNVIFIVLGAFSSTFDTLTRLSNQKYNNSEYELNLHNQENEKDNLKTDTRDLMFLIRHLEEALGIGGWLPHFILLAVIFNFMDLIVLYCFLFYGAFFVFGMMMSIHKAVKKQREIEKSMEEKLKL